MNKRKYYLEERTMEIKKFRLAEAFHASCPKHRMCKLYQSAQDTCRHGPYSYCGEFRHLDSIKQSHA